MKKAAKRKAPHATPVIAVRVDRALHQRIKESAKTAGRSMSEQMAWLIENGLNWEKTLGDRNEIIEDARQILRAVTAEAKQLQTANLKAELRRRNWRHNEKGEWAPPEVHGLPPDGFIPATEEGEKQ